MLQRIIDDLRESIAYLPQTPIHVLRPSKPAAYGLLARAFLSMRNYDSAYHYSDLCLHSFAALVDFNTLSSSASYPVALFNPEVIFDSYMTIDAPLNSSTAKIDSNLINLYQTGDLRKTIFFKNNLNGTYGFKGSYEHSSNLFNGIATDEIYLIHSECAVRLGNLQKALEDLNTLLITRWTKGSYQSIVTSDTRFALTKILQERRKELLMRGLRWMDLKRLNKESANIVLLRIINGETYTLSPDDLRYALPIPDDVIALSGMQQNPR